MHVRTCQNALALRGIGLDVMLTTSVAIAAPSKMQRPNGDQIVGAATQRTCGGDGGYIVGAATQRNDVHIIILALPFPAIGGNPPLARDGVDFVPDGAGCLVGYAKLLLVQVRPAGSRWRASCCHCPLVNRQQRRSALTLEDHRAFLRHLSVMRTPVALPPSSNGKEQRMPERRRFKQVDPLDKRLSEEAARLRKEARGTPPGVERERLLRRARHAETAAHISEWLSSPGLKAPT
jgi:hypothetical protein